MAWIQNLSQVGLRTQLSDSTDDRIKSPPGPRYGPFLKIDRKEVCTAWQQAFFTLAKVQINPAAVRQCVLGLVDLRTCYYDEWPRRYGAFLEEYDRSN